MFGEIKMKKELYTYINDRITKKGFDSFTSKKILDYLETHDLLYGHIIDTKDVVDRIRDNLNQNIKFDFKKDNFSRGGYRTNS